jgi:hypothetical protein
MTLNSRFVVPLAQAADNTTTFHTLSAALTTPGLTSGDIIQIEQDSAPGLISNADVDAINATNVTIRGNPAFAADELPAFATGNAITLDAGEAGLTLLGVNFQINQTFSFNANGTIQDSLVTIGSTGGDGLQLLGTTGAVLRHNTIINNGVTSANDVIQVNTAPNAANQITANSITSKTGGGYSLFYQAVGSHTIADEVAWNTFTGANVQETNGARMILVSGDLTGLTIRDNTFHDDTAEFAAVYLFVGPNNVAIRDNVFEMIYDATPSEGAILIDASANPTSATVTGNSFETGANGRAIEVRVNSSPAVGVRFEANDFVNTPLGVLVKATSGAAQLGDIDLGGGPLSSLGMNSFRIFRTPASATAGAIVVDAGAIDVSAATINAQNNLFGAPDPATVIRDNADDATEATVVTTGALAGNTAFVQSLYVNFLGRAGEASGVAGWVAQADAGNSAAVGEGIVRSTEALQRVVAGLYQNILGRAGGDVERAGWVAYLQGGGTLEAATARFYGSSEHAARIGGSNAAFVKRLYLELLGRAPDGQSGWIGALDSGTLTREQVAAGFLTSLEYRTNFIQGLYADLLKRDTAPSAVEVNWWVNSGLDLLSLRGAFASTPEYQANG